jgi:hypothetical protein
VVFLSIFLQKLSGVALWIPSPWRRIVAALVTLAGMAIFSLARMSRARIEREGHKVGEGRSRVPVLALLCLMVTFLFLVPQLFLRHHCVVTWNPDDVVVLAEYGNPPDLDAVPPPAQLERTAAGYRGSVLVPLRSRLSLELRQRIEGRATRYGEPGIRAFLDNEPIHFIESLEDESRAIWETVALILIVHTGVIVSAAAAYGYSFNWVEELIEALTELG